jgi:hypothetical protein
MVLQPSASPPALDGARPASVSEADPEHALPTRQAALAIE